MTSGRPPVEPPIIRTRLPAWMHVRDVLLTLGAWLLIGYFLREGLYLAYDYFRAPIFELTTATAPDWSEVWGRLRGFVLLAATLVVWLTFWALDSRARLQATHSPQPAPLLDASHAAHFGLTEAELAAGRLAKVQTVDIDPERHTIVMRDGHVGNVAAGFIPRDPSSAAFHCNSKPGCDKLSIEIFGSDRIQLVRCASPCAVGHSLPTFRPCANKPAPAARATTVAS